MRPLTEAELGALQAGATGTVTRTIGQTPFLREALMAVGLPAGSNIDGDIVRILSKRALRLLRDVA